MFINDLPDAVNHSSLYMFADDTKCAKLIRNPSDSVLLQDDVTSLGKWSSDWKLQFKVTKCVLLRFCTKGASVCHSYSMGGNEVPEHTSHKDLGVVFSSDLTFTAHYDMIIKRAYRVLGLLRRTFRASTNVHEKLLLYVSLVRSQLLYCSQIWRPYLVSDIAKLERVQRRATKFILNDYTSDYKARLLALNLLPLMFVLELRDVMVCVQSFKSPTRDFDIMNFVSFSSGDTRSSAARKMRHASCSTNSVKHFYFNRLPRLWNLLPQVDLGSSVELIKSRLQAFLFVHFKTNFDPNNSCTTHFMYSCSKCGNLAHPPNFKSS